MPKMVFSCALIMLKRRLCTLRNECQKEDSFSYAIDGLKMFFVCYEYLKDVFCMLRILKMSLYECL